MKLPSLKRLQTKCDSLLTPIIKLKHPQCLLCGGETQVGHHFIKKSKSSILRYNIENIIPLCTSCHFRLHFNDESYWASKIVEKRGLKWFHKLEREKNKIIKVDRLWYENNYKRLESLLKESDEISRLE